MIATSSRPLRLLFVDGNTPAHREGLRTAYGMAYGEAYAAEIAAIAPGIVSDICLPADEGANLPDGAGLESYDGIFLTGSALHIYEIEPAVTRQVELMRAIYASGTPCFGSCWGIQVGSVAAGGTVTANPKGREVGFARRIAPTEAGRGHALLASRPAALGTTTRGRGRRTAATIASATSSGSTFFNPGTPAVPAVSSVFTKAGSTVVNATPERAYSSRAVSVKPRTACLVPTYVAAPGA